MEERMTEEKDLQDTESKVYELIEYLISTFDIRYSLLASDWLKIPNFRTILVHDISPQKN